MYQRTVVTLSFLTLLLASSAVWAADEDSVAATGPAVATVVESPSPAKLQKNYKMAVILAKNVSLFKTGDGKDTESLYGALVGSYKFSDRLTAGFLVDRGYDEKTQEAEWFRMSVSATFKKFEGTHLDIAPRLTLGLPANKKDAADSLRARIGAGASVTVKTRMPKIDLTYSPLFSYANFAYSTNEFTGNPNTPFSFLQDLSLVYSFTDKISAKISALYLVQQTSTGFLKEGWAHGQELGWQATENIGFAFGHQFGVPYAPTRKANQDVNLAVFNDKDSIIYTQVTVSL